MLFVWIVEVEAKRIVAIRITSPDFLSQGMENIESNTCIEFVPATEDDKAYVNIAKTAIASCSARQG